MACEDAIGPFNPEFLWPPEAESGKPLPGLDARAQDFLAECHAIAAALLGFDTTFKDRWTDAEMARTGMLCFVCACEVDPKQRNLTLVRLLLTDRKKFALSLEVMR